MIAMVPDKNQGCRMWNMLDLTLQTSLATIGFHCQVGFHGSVCRCVSHVSWAVFRDLGSHGNLAVIASMSLAKFVCTHLCMRPLNVPSVACTVQHRLVMNVTRRRLSRLSHCPSFDKVLPLMLYRSRGCTFMTSAPLVSISVL